jgi:hypothetical protein
MTQMLFLNVPPAEYDEVKALGACLHKGREQWFVQDREKYFNFGKWILDEGEDECTILFDHFYIVAGNHTCFDCKNTTQVIAFLLPIYYLFPNEWLEDYDVNEHHKEAKLVSEMEPFPLHDMMLAHLKDEYKYYYDHSKTANSNYYANHCKKCDAIQGAGYLFQGVNLPFHVNEEKDAKALKLYHVPTKADLKVQYKIVLDTNADLIHCYGERCEDKAVPYFSTLL